MPVVRSVMSVAALVLASLAAAAPAVVAGPGARATSPGTDGRIAFVRAQQVYTMTATGGSVRKVTSVGRNVRPAWSPDGRRIAYIHALHGHRAVWVMNANGSGKRAVTAPGTVTSAGVAWSPDGRTLAFGGSAVAGSGGNDLMFVSSTDRGAVPRAVGGHHTRGECDDPEEQQPTIEVDRFLAWSPDVGGGSRIAVQDSSDCYYDWVLRMYFPRTGEARQVMASGADRVGYMLWSDYFFGPNGRFGYTEQDRGDFTGTPGPRRIVYPGFTSRKGDTGGAPSPSGRFMALTNNAPGTAYVIRAKADGTGRQRLTIGYQPDWGVKPQ